MLINVLAFRPFVDENAGRKENTTPAPPPKVGFFLYNSHSMLIYTPSSSNHLSTRSHRASCPPSRPTPDARRSPSRTRPRRLRHPKTSSRKARRHPFPSGLRPYFRSSRPPPTRPTTARQRARRRGLSSQPSPRLAVLRRPTWGVSSRPSGTRESRSGCSVDRQRGMRIHLRQNLRPLRNRARSSHSSMARTTRSLPPRRHARHSANVRLFALRSPHFP